MVKNRRQQKPPTIGTGTASDDFAGVARRAWIYVGRVRSGTEPESVESYLSGKCPGIKFQIETLRSDERDCSFKVGFDFDRLGVVTDAAVWPKDVIVRRFNVKRGFFRGKSGNHSSEGSAL